MATLARFGVDRINFCECQSLDRILLVDKDHAGGGLAERAHAAGRDANLKGLIAKLVDEQFFFGRQQFATDRRSVRAIHQPRCTSAGGTRFDRDAHLRRICLAVELGPAKGDLIHHVGTDQIELFLGRIDLDFTRHPFRNRRIDFQLMLDWRVFQGNCRRDHADG